jgi:hypothetical protein
MSSIRQPTPIASTRTSTENTCMQWLSLEKPALLSGVSHCLPKKVASTRPLWIVGASCRGQRGTNDAVVVRAHFPGSQRRLRGTLMIAKEHLFCSLNFARRRSFILLLDETPPARERPAIMQYNMDTAQRRDLTPRCSSRLNPPTTWNIWSLS